MGDATVDVAGAPDDPSGAELETRVANGLYTLGIEMSGAKSGHATGVAVLHDGCILGGDSFFYYTGSPSLGPGPRRGATNSPTPTLPPRRDPVVRGPSAPA